MKKNSRTTSDNYASVGWLWGKHLKGEGEGDGYNETSGPAVNFVEDEFGIQPTCT